MSLTSKQQGTRVPARAVVVSASKASWYTDEAHVRLMAQAEPQQSDSFMHRRERERETQELKKSWINIWFPQWASGLGRVDQTCPLCGLPQWVCSSLAGKWNVLIRHTDSDSSVSSQFITSLAQLSLSKHKTNAYTSELPFHSNEKTSRRVIMQIGAVEGERGDTVTLWPQNVGGQNSEQNSVWGNVQLKECAGRASDLMKAKERPCANEAWILMDSGTSGLLFQLQLALLTDCIGRLQANDRLGSECN